MRPDADPEFAALLALSAELGGNVLRTQAAGGNTSLKRGGTMWIKASGTWLADALAGDIMVPVNTEPLLAALAAGDRAAEKAIAFLAPEGNPRGLRPSVETSVHAVMPQRVVVHIHCVATVALAVRKDAESLIAERLPKLPGLRAAFLPYIHPGVPLANAIARLKPAPNVIVLGNHGLIVAGESVPEVKQRLAQVTASFEAPRRTAPAADLAALALLAEGSTWRLPKDPAAHDTANDPASLAIARQGTLYPDHVVFLGPGIFVTEEEPIALAARFASGAVEGPRMLVLPGRGVLIHRDAIRGADELARGLAEVTARIPAGAEVNTLTARQEADLVNWDAETYRLAMAKSRVARGG